MADDNSPEGAAAAAAAPAPGNEMVTVLGGEELEVTYRDGTKELVKVRQLPVREFSRYALVMEDEPAKIELVCEKEKGWADRLAPESYDAVAEKEHGLNFPFFRGWFRRKTAATDLLDPGMLTLIQKAISNRIAELQSPDSASPSPQGQG